MASDLHSSGRVVCRMELDIFGQCPVCNVISLINNGSVADRKEKIKGISLVTIEVSLTLTDIPQVGSHVLGPDLNKLIVSY